MSSSVLHVDNKKKDTLNLGEGPTQGLDGTILTAEKTYSGNFTEPCYLFVNGTKNYKFKAKDSETVATPLCLKNISKSFSADNMKTILWICLCF